MKPFYKNRWNEDSQKWVPTKPSDIVDPKEVSQDWRKPVKINQPRARYFQVFRPERTMLSIIENTRLLNNSRQSYRACRFVYYVVLPHLDKSLWFAPDRVRLLDVEHDLFNQLLSYLFVKGGRHKEPNRVFVRSSRYQGLT